MQKWSRRSSILEKCKEEWMQSKIKWKQINKQTHHTVPLGWVKKVCDKMKQDRGWKVNDGEKGGLHNGCESLLMCSPPLKQSAAKKTKYWLCIGKSAAKCGTSVWGYRDRDTRRNSAFRNKKWNEKLNFLKTLAKAVSQDNVPHPFPHGPVQNESFCHLVKFNKFNSGYVGGLHKRMT